MVAGAVRDPARFLDWADVVLLVSNNMDGGVKLKENVSHNIKRAEQKQKPIRRAQSFYAIYEKQ